MRFSDFRFTGHLSILLLMISTLPEALTAAAGSDWKAGTASIVITPQQPLWMAGYAARKKPSEGTEMELRAKALALEDRRGNRLVIITSDLLGFPRSLSDPIAEKLRQQHGLRRDQILLTSSHTHSGPVIRDSLFIAYDLPADQVQAVRAYTAWLQERVVQVVAEALGRLQPAHLSFARGEAGFVVNRRLKTDRGYVINVNPEGPADKEVPVLRIEKADGGLLAALFSYACHNTTLGGDNYRFHGDYAGVAQEELEKRHPGATMLFMIGCAADTNPHPRGTLDHVRAHGHALAESVAAVLSGSFKTVKGPLKTTFGQVDLPFAKVPDRSELEARLGQPDVYRQRLARALLRELDEKGRISPTYPYSIGTARFGKDLTLVALAGEVVVDYDRRLKKELAKRNPWITGYANDVFGYIASRRVLAEGGYEAETSMVYYGLPSPWSPEIEEQIVKTVHRLLK